MPGVDFPKLPLDSLPLFLRGADDLPDALYEQIFRSGIGVIAVKPKAIPAPEQFSPAKLSIRSVAFRGENRSFQRPPGAFPVIGCCASISHFVSDSFSSSWLSAVAPAALSW